ncbi:DUF3375 family protein, partial [Thalassospira xiamenensis]
AAPLPPVAVALSGLPVVERLRFKSLEDDATGELSLVTRDADLAEIDEAFWAAFDGLDRDTLVQQTLAVLAEEGRPVSLAELARRLPPTHDLETFALWLGMAREAGIPVDGERIEEVELED